MSFYNKLKNKLKNKLSEKNLKALPHGYQIVGKIFLIKLRPELLKYKKTIGKSILELFPYIHSVGLIKEIKGIKRKPRIEIICGCKNTQTLHKEYGCKFLLDVSKIMWSQGNKDERIRIVKLVKANETIVDMFAGIGYFSLGLGKFTESKRIYSIEINPISYHYLWENIKLNKLEGKIFPILGDCLEICNELGRIADRVIMGFLPTPKDYLESAAKIVKKNGMIHYHSILRKVEDQKNLLLEIESVFSKTGLKVKLINFKKVKSYAPKVNHVVLDVNVY